MKVFAVVAVLVFAMSASASAATAVRARSSRVATRPRTVVLRLTVIGSGTVRVSGSHAFTCHAYSCRNTFHLSSGRLTVARALPVAGWKLTTWAGACVGSTATCSLRLQTRRSVAVTFVPPGARLNAFRLGKAVRMPEFEQGGVWRMKVKSATINADAAVEAVIDPYTSQPYNGPPGPGVQYTLVNLSLTHVRGGSASPSRFVIRNAQLAAEGAHSGSYTPDACVPPSPDLEALPNDRVSSGHTVTGNLCFMIDSNDAGTLLMSAVIDTDTADSGNTERTVWFALH